MTEFDSVNFVAFCERPPGLRGQQPAIHPPIPGDYQAISADSDFFWPARTLNFELWTLDFEPKPGGERTGRWTMGRWTLNGRNAGQRSEAFAD